MLNEKNNWAKITAFYTVSLDGFEMQSHEHKSYEIMYVSSGSCDILLQDKWLSLNENEFVFIEPNIQHALFCSPERECTLLNLEFELENEKLDFNIGDVLNVSEGFKKLKNEPLEIGYKKDVRQLGNALKMVIQVLTNEENQANHTPETSLTIELLFKRMLLELFFCLSFSEKKRGNIYVNRAIDYILEHFAETLKIPEIANHVGINKSYLHLIFQEQTGKTLIEFINHERLKHAVFLLCNSQLPIVEIAVQSGFNSRQHFTSTFKKRYQLSPKKYQQLYRQEIKQELGQHRLESEWEFLLMK